MNRKQKKMLYRILIAAALLILVNLLPLPMWAKYIVYAAAYFTVGWDILRKAALGVAHRQVFDENFLMAVATLGAIGLAVADGNGDFNEAVAVMLFYQIGELFQGIAVGKSRRSIAALMDIRPDYANIEVDGRLEQVDPDEVEVGSVIVVQPGERVPIDGVVLEGTSSINTAALTGESVPRDVMPGDEVISGCINLNGVSWSKTPVPTSPVRKTSSPGLRGSIPPPCVTARWRWPCCRRLSGSRWACPPISAPGPTAPSPSWSSAAPARS